MSSRQLPGLLLVYAAVACDADVHTGLCRASQERLAERIGMHRKNLGPLLQMLAKLGYLQIAEKTGFNRVRNITLTDAIAAESVALSSPLLEESEATLKLVAGPPGVEPKALTNRMLPNDQYAVRQLAAREARYGIGNHAAYVASLISKKSSRLPEGAEQFAEQAPLLAAREAKFSRRRAQNSSSAAATRADYDKGYGDVY